MSAKRVLLSVSVDGLLHPKFSVRVQAEVTSAPGGWGVGWYPNNQTGAVIHKDPKVSAEVVHTEESVETAKFCSNYYLLKSRGEASGYTHHETQPFSRMFAGSEWLFAHCGDLDKSKLEERFTAESRFLEPVGTTDSEIAFCYLLSRLQGTDARSISELDAETLRIWLSDLDLLGSADLVLTDGHSAVCYHGQNSDQELYFGTLAPPNQIDLLESERLTVKFDDPRDLYRTKLLVTSERFSSGMWTKMEPGQLLISCHGAIVWNSHPQLSAAGPVAYPTQAKQSRQVKSEPEPNFASVQTEQAQTNQTITNLRSITRGPEGRELTYRMFDINHVTEYHYTEPVEHSTHWFRLQPQENTTQSVEYSVISISSPGEQMQFEDVFGNQSLHYTIHEPYSSLRVENRSRVKVYARPDDDTSHSRRQTTIPLVWMPWQRQMMTPYLLPEELPDTQLEELSSYAMSFVERNGYHLLDTLKDINSTIYRDYEYSPGLTSVKTTPFEVYTRRVGVCQDFANILICLARLLGVPARYQVGYIYTGGAYENKIQSDASHAWVELYLPFIGWRGFDPTNGCLVNQDHISVARGRNFRDATPTSGTLFKGGGKETLSVEVKVEEV